ncbi:alpha/beta hydrolase [Tropicimonas sp. IMCC34043]|uniref:alpha/beta hydrolase n=1 Tax=Tropicimonas sp. IMCC34043 TaxID=2248760 RepID=UPI000E279431|nr:alpha/beta hydrolase [Tropicimonas sp. IMCC34043]
MIDPTAYDNADFIPEGHGYFDRWVKQAAAFRAAHPATLQRLDLAYGPHPREAYDLFLPQSGAPVGLVIFVHGGFWQLGGRKDWSHLAAGALGHGWAVALPSYPLAPEARIAKISRAVVRAVEAAAETTQGPILLSGHSAGGHLALRTVCPGAALSADVRARIAGVLAISPIVDLNPLLLLPMNEFLLIDADEAESESPMLYPQPDCPVQIEIGAMERPAFIDQALRLADAWPAAELTVTEGRHHFDVPAPLSDPESRLVTAMLSMAEDR